jgi:protein gp37
VSAGLGHNNDHMRGSVVAGRWLQGFFPKNVWLGVSAESQQKMSERVFYLRQVEARIRFLVLQPLLSPVKIGHWFDRSRFESDSFNWLVIGGEHGDGARKFETAWAEDLVAEARVFGLPVWVQGVGSNAFSLGQSTSTIKLATSDERGEVPADWPEALRVRELPELEG